jgi:DNA-directed RNA polymerase specialized sigma24 family protein
MPTAPSHSDITRTLERRVRALRRYRKARELDARDIAQEGYCAALDAIRRAPRDPEACASVAARNAMGAYVMRAASPVSAPDHERGELRMLRSQSIGPTLLVEETTPEAELLKKAWREQVRERLLEAAGDNPVLRGVILVDLCGLSPRRAARTCGPDVRPSDITAARWLLRERVRSDAHLERLYCERPS